MKRKWRLITIGLLWALSTMSMPVEAQDAPFFWGWHSVRDHQIEAAAQTGVQIVMDYWSNRTPSEMLAYLDQVAAHNCQTMLDVLQLSTTDIEALLTDHPEICAHPALWGWYLADEPEYGKFAVNSPENITARYNILKEFTPDKPVVLVIREPDKFFEKYPHWASFCDGIMLDIYPLWGDTPTYPPDYSYGIQVIPDDFQAMMRQVQQTDKKHVFFLPQTFGYAFQNDTGAIEPNGVWGGRPALMLHNETTVNRSEPFRLTENGGQIQFWVRQEDKGTFGIQFGQPHENQSYRQAGYGLVFENTNSRLMARWYEDGQLIAEDATSISGGLHHAFDPAQRYVRVRLVLTPGGRVRLFLYRNAHIPEKYRAPDWSFSEELFSNVNLSVDSADRFWGLFARESITYFKTVEVQTEAWASAVNFRDTFTNPGESTWTAGEIKRVPDPWFRRAPTYEEFQFMCYGPVALGANGLLFWSFNRSTDDIRKMTQKLQAEFEANGWRAGRSFKHLVSCDNGDILFEMTRHDQNERVFNLLVVNTAKTETAATFTLSFPTTHVRINDTPLSVSTGERSTFRDIIPIIGTKLYQIYF